ncbi:MAG: hypothetical protein JOZ52_07200, partial [Acidobacteria bacterium]|nr:hypothetical protein [Acidobacteriota bacterium]
MRAEAPTLMEVGLAALSALLLILSFPNFNLWPLAWVGLVPLIISVARAPELRWRALMLGWIAGTTFFYGSCYWLTYSMVRYGHIPKLISYLLLLPITIVVGIFPALFCVLLARLISRFGALAVLAAAPIWVALEWARLGLTGQLWNAVGYSQAYVPRLIQPASWGGVYAVGFLILMTNAALALLFLRRMKSSLLISSLVIICVA